MYRFECVNNKVEVFLYSMIVPDGGYGLSARDVIAAIKGAGDNVSIIDLHINSDGGDVFEALSMYNYLSQHKAKVKVFIDGIAASAASIVAMSGEVHIPTNAMMMIHNPCGHVYGPSDEMREMAEILDKLRDNISKVYEAKTGLTHDEIVAIMDAETWLNADEAVAMKFADKIIEAKNEAEKIQNISANITSGASAVASVDEAVSAERERIRQLDMLNAPGCEEIIRAAKYENFKTAQEVAYEILTTKNFEDVAKDTAQARMLDALDTENIAVAVKQPEAGSEIVDAISKRINERRGF